MKIATFDVDEWARVGSRRDRSITSGKSRKVPLGTSCCPSNVCWPPTGGGLTPVRGRASGTLTREPSLGPVESGFLQEEFSYTFPPLQRRRMPPGAKGEGAAQPRPTTVVNVLLPRPQPCRPSGCGALVGQG
jgi:hypothetical protein